MFFPLLIAVIHVPAAERSRFLPQPKRPAQRSEAAESSYQQSKCLRQMLLLSPHCMLGLCDSLTCAALRIGTDIISLTL